jgi:hypothetical protein
LIRLENVAAIDPRSITAFDSVLANCEIVMAAAEDFAQLSGGPYPADLSDPLPNGDTMIDLLPGGKLLTNPYVGLKIDPSDGNGLHYPGGIGYVAVDFDGYGFVDGYIIEAYGAIGEIIAKRTLQSPEDYYPRRACLGLKVAVDEFAAANEGEYPRDIDADQTPAGDTLLDLIAYEWANPYTGAPGYRNGLATSRGEVGYQPLEYDGVVVGYVINALGLFEEELERFEVLTN